MSELTKTIAHNIYNRLGPTAVCDEANRQGHSQWGHCAACDCDVPTLAKECLLCGSSTTATEYRSSISLRLTEIATILAALRYWQREGLGSGVHEKRLAEEHGPALDADDIDELCQWINSNGVSSRDPSHPIPEPDPTAATDLIRLGEKARDEISTGDPVKAEAHLTSLLALLKTGTPSNTTPTPEACLTVADAVDIVLKLARAHLNDSPEPDAQGLSAEACRVVEDYAVNHLGD